ncbi:MAG: PEP-CTERM-box response regulator transcription factor, partial [Thiohalomonadales bacterium]
YDFYQKPIDPDMLGLIIERAYKLYDLEQQNKKLSSLKQPSPLHGMIAGSASMLKVCKEVEKVAPTNVTALILGDSGTGKELVARAIHNLSDRANKPFIAINSAAIPENLLESELFGYERGAFTGANKQTKGKIEYADGGTFFLDELGDLPISLQAKILRFLQERVIERIGGRKEIPVDVRVICATHRDLTQLISEKIFREDLYYRISEVTIKIPNLKDRDGDALMIARVLLENISAMHSKKIRGFTKEAVATIESYGWPGNVRELENKIKRAVIMADDKYITSEDLDIDIANFNQELHLDLRQIREIAESKAINRALSISGNSMSKAAEILGVSRPTLYDLINKLNLK